MVQQTRLVYPALATLLSIFPQGMMVRSLCFQPTVRRGTQRFLSTRPLLQDRNLPLIVGHRPNDRFGIHPISFSGSRTRQYASLFNNNPRGPKKSFLERAAEKVKETGSKYLPALFGPPSPEQERKMAIERQQKAAKEEINSLLKDAPLGMRILGRAISPLVSSMAGAFAEQSAAVEDVLEQAQDLIDRDQQIASRFGSPVRLGPPFGQSSSSSNINGRVSTQVQLQLPVTAGNGSQGTGSVVAVNGVIEEFTVNMNGQYYDVSLDPSSNVRVVDDSGYSSNNAEVFTSGSSRLGKNSRSSDVIDAEFVEKKQSR